MIVAWCWKDTEDEGDQRAAGERHPYVGHQVIERCDGDAVRQHTLQTHKQHAGWKGDARAHVVQSLSVVHLQERADFSNKARRASEEIVEQVTVKKREI